MPERSVKQQILLEEMAGKNAAIHAYDHIIWVVRSGYLTLFFAGWALMLKALVEATPSAESPESIMRYLPMMLVMSAGLTIGGLAIDLNYVIRKFRVIASLDRLMELAFQYGDAPENAGEDAGDLLATLQIAGDAGFSPFPVPKGRKTAMIAALVVYLTPFICLGIIWELGSFQVFPTEQ